MMHGRGDFSGIENVMLSVIERWWASRYSERHGLVTAYDPDKYLAKVTFQPEGQESGWLPIETGHIGEGYGIAVGLQPGDGKATGDQVIVRFQEGDFEGGKIVQRVHSEQDTPPPVKSGELVIWSKFRKSGGGENAAEGGQGGTGQKFFFKNDGSIVITDGNGATLTFDGAGNVKLVCKKFDVEASDDINVKGEKAANVHAKTIELKDGAGDTITMANGTVTVKANKIITDGETHLGSAGGVPSSKQGTVDSRGDADVSNLAQKVFVT